ncbi:MAG: hypothetical protein WCY61_05490 [Sphaerochaeta sp.]
MKRWASVLIIILLATSAFASSLAAAFSYKLPVDLFIGQVVEPQSSSIEEQSKEALKEGYSPSWIETYVPEGMRQGFVHTYNHLLANLLPAEQLQIGKAIQFGSLVEVPFRIFAPVPLSGMLVWVESDEGEPYLLSLSTNQ